MGAMERAELEQFIQDNYGVEPDYPWRKSPNFAVFRHSSNQKWFALVMEVPRDNWACKAQEHWLW